VPASSGMRIRHRLNRHGNRQLNAALHRIAFTQARMHAPAKGYLERKRTEGKTRKEALARQKQQAKAAKVARKTPTAAMTPAQRRAAMRSGDPAALPRRDQGPTRKLARDYVDSHRMFSNYLLMLFPLMIVSYLLPYVQYVVIFVFLALIVEWYLTGRRVRGLAVERNGSAQGSAMSIGFYAGSRAYLPRRWRLPAPQKALGETF